LRNCRVLAASGRRLVVIVPGSDALHRGPGLPELAINGEKVLGQQPLPPRLLQHGREKLAGNVVLQQRFAVLGESSGMKAGSEMLRSKNHSKRRSYCSRSQNCRSERTE
jgi:hypothetical protein